MARDDKQITKTTIDLSGGMNNRQHEQIIKENQATVLQNISLDTPGERKIRPGLTLIGTFNSSVPNGLFTYDAVGGSTYLIGLYNNELKWWSGSGGFSSIASCASVPSLNNSFVKAGKSGVGDVVLMCDGTNYARELTPTPSFTIIGTASINSFPTSKVFAFYRNRCWVLKNNLLYFSSAYPSSYSSAFDTVSNAFYVPVGSEVAIMGTRESGLILIGKNQIWGLNPSVVPAPDTDKPEKILDMGGVNGRTFKQVGDDIFGLFSDGVRGIFRTQLDKLQVQQSYPLSYVLKNEYEEISWANIDKACAESFDGKYFISLPTNSSTYNNKVWAYYPAFNGWIVITGWNISDFSVMRVGNQDGLYGTDALTGKVFRCWNGTSDNGTAIAMQEESRGETFGDSSVYKSGGEFRVRFRESEGTVKIYASVDNSGYSYLGELVLSQTKVTFPVTFPVTFASLREDESIVHLDRLGKFRRIKIKIYCDSLDAAINIIESSLSTFADSYYSEKQED